MKWFKAVIEIARDNPLYVWVLMFGLLAFAMLLVALAGTLL